MVLKPGDMVVFTGAKLHGDLKDLRITDPPVGLVGYAFQFSDHTGLFTVDFGLYGTDDFLAEELRPWPTPTGRTPDFPDDPRTKYTPPRDDPTSR